MTDEAMPSAEMAEKGILSAIMQEPRRFLALASSEGVDRECFHHHARIYDEVRSYLDQNPDLETVDVPSFISGLLLAGTLDRCGGPAVVQDIYGYTYGIFAGWTNWCEQVKECKARRIARLAADRLREAQDSGEAIQRIKDTLESLTATVCGRAMAKSAMAASSEFIKRWKADFDSSEDFPGLPTGYPELDEICGGMRGGELWVVCALPSRGKSVMMLEIAGNALIQGKTVAVFSLEMLADVVIGRLVSTIGSVDYEAITKPKKSNKHQRAGMGRALETLKTSKLWVDDRDKISMDDIQNECQRIKDATGELDLIVVDYIQIVEGEKRRNETREQEVSRISMDCKQLARRFKVPVISGSQLNSDGKTRESRGLEQHADGLLFIADDGVKVGKMRNAPRDMSLQLFLHGDRQRFLTYPAPVKK